jgi:two-component system, cell cycle sensor histidine kinase and response regulator CckA
VTTAAMTRFRPVRAAVLVGVLGVLVAVAFDRWYEATLIERERDRVQALAAPYTQQIAGFFDRRLSRLDALRAFVEAEPALSSLYADWPTFSEGLSAAAPGVRAFQLVRKARIMRSWPEHDDSLLVDFDLLRHPVAAVAEDVKRALTTDSMVLTGPFPLVQGGDGMVVRQRLRPFGPEGPDMVAIVLDLGALIDEAGLRRIDPSIAYSLTDNSGRVIASRGHPEAATETRLGIANATWTLRMAPADGWTAAVSSELRATRAASALLWFMLLYLTVTVVGRQRALAIAVDERTHELAEANEELRREVEERRALEEQLLHSQKMEAVGTLAGGIAHDFNNLLTAITGFAQLSEQHTVTMQERTRDTDDHDHLHELRTDITEILKAADRASLLTSQLLAFSRRQKVTPDRNDVNVVVHDLERMLQRLIGERVSLVTELAAQPLCVMADAGQLSQVLMNLVVNARDALSNGGRVQVTTEALTVVGEAPPPFSGLAAGDWVLIRVEDDGVGMNHEVMSRMFEPFFTTKHIGDGTGLGLSMVYGIVTQAGGRLFVDSAPGQGTTVSVVLPRLATVPATPSPVSAASPHAEGELVLVVEDEAGLRRLVREILHRKGFRVLMAPDGVDALQALDEQREAPDLVLTDVVMPRMGGRELATVLRARGFDMPVLFMSGYQDGEEMPDDPSYSYIAKPFTPDALVEKVRRVLGAVV